jgi:poly(3-hydroxybutyrate) depolymerase
MAKRRRADGPEEQQHSEVQQQQQQQRQQQQPSGLSEGSQQQSDEQDGDAQLEFNQLSGMGHAHPTTNSCIIVSASGLQLLVLQCSDCAQ